MKILYLPLDERPCNTLFPQQQFSPLCTTELIMPAKSLLGKKKIAGDIEGIQRWVAQTIENCDVAVLSLESYLFGGLLPSRLHHRSLDTLKKELSLLESYIVQVKQSRAFRCYTFSVIMRSPGYSSDEEEPSYYAQYGREIFRRGYLSHKKSLVGLTPEETTEWQSLDIPPDIIHDYESRRSINFRTTVHALHMVHTSVVDCMIIPEDDTAQHGYGLRDKQLLNEEIQKLNIHHALRSYPGADELGCSQTCRAVVDTHMIRPRIWTEFLDSAAITAIPKYESMPLGESCQQQIKAAGGDTASSPESADIILALNTGPLPYQEARDQILRSDPSFMHKVATFFTSGKPVIIADTAYSNGGDTSLLTAMETHGLWDQVIAYAGWNTTGNTLGTAIASGILQYLFPDATTRKRNIYLRLVEDWAYQTIIRWELTRELHEQGISSQSLPDAIADTLPSRLHNLIHRYLPTITSWGFRIASSHFPWNRFFEISLSLAE